MKWLTVVLFCGLAVAQTAPSLPATGQLSTTYQTTVRNWFTYLETYKSQVTHLHTGVYAPLAHVHIIADVTNLQTALDAKEPAAGNPSVSGYCWSSLTNGTRSWISCGGGGNVLAYTANHTVISGDCGNWLTMNGSSLTLTLANPPVSSTCSFAVQNLAASSLTIARNSLTINGVASNITLAAISGVVAQELSCWTDGSNYFCSQGPKGDTGPAGADGDGGSGGASQIDYQSVTGTKTGNVTIYSTSIPANTIGAGKCIRVEHSIESLTLGGPGPLYDICFGSTCVGGMMNQGSSTTTTSGSFDICNNAGVTNAQKINSWPWFSTQGATNNFNGFAGPVASPAEDTTGAVTVLLKVISGAGTDTTKGWFWHIWGPF